MKNFEIKISNQEELEGYCLMEGTDHNEVIEELRTVVASGEPYLSVQIEHDNGLYDFEVSETQHEDDKVSIIYTFDI